MSLKKCIMDVKTSFIFQAVNTHIACKIPIACFQVVRHVVLKNELGIDVNLKQIICDFELNIHKAMKKMTKGNEMALRQNS